MEPNEIDQHGTVEAHHTPDLTPPPPVDDLPGSVDEAAALPDEPAREVDNTPPAQPDTQPLETMPATDQTGFQAFETKVAETQGAAEHADASAKAAQDTTEASTQPPGEMVIVLRLDASDVGLTLNAVRAMFTEFQEHVANEFETLHAKIAGIHKRYG